MILFPGSGNVIPGDEFTAERLKLFLNSIPGKATRKVAIGIDNESGFSWEDPTTYFRSGSAEGELPYYLHDGKVNFANVRWYSSNHA